MGIQSLVCKWVVQIFDRVAIFCIDFYFTLSNLFHMWKTHFISQPRVRDEIFCMFGFNGFNKKHFPWEHGFCCVVWQRYQYVNVWLFSVHERLSKFLIPINRKRNKCESGYFSNERKTKSTGSSFVQYNIR